MEKRTIVVIVLSILFLVVWNYFFVAPKQAELREKAAAERALLEAAAAAEPDAAPPPAASDPGGARRHRLADLIAGTGRAAETGTWPAVAAAAEETVVIEDSLYRVELTNAGGRVKSWILKSFNGGDGDPLELVSASAHTLGRLPLEIAYGGPGKFRPDQFRPVAG